MTLVMYDSIDVTQFAGLTMDAAAGYVDGAWPTFPTLGQHVPAGTILVSITVFGGQPADCVDIEPGNIDEAGGAAWVAGELAAGSWKPIVYTSASNVPNVLSHLSAAGVDRGQIRLWSAHYTGHPHICAPAVCGYSQADGTQWTSSAHGRNLDQSELASSFFQPPPPPPASAEDDPMMVCSFTNPANGNQEMWEINSAGELWHHVWRPASGWEKPVTKLGTGYEGSPAYAADSKGGLNVWAIRKGGVDVWRLDPANTAAGWVKTAGV